MKLSSSIGILVLGFAAFASCKKKSGATPVPTPPSKVDTSATAKLVGKWKDIKDGYDGNNNGTMEPQEVTIIPDSMSEIVIFNGDGSGSSEVQYPNATAYSQPFTWKLINNDKDLVLTVIQSGAAAADTAHIESITSSDFEVSTRQDNGTGTMTKSWTFLHKQ